jgi:phosphoribosylaminoimidazole (AIR) synthetase
VALFRKGDFMNIRTAARIALFSTLAARSAGAWANGYTFVDLGAYVKPAGIDSKGVVAATRNLYNPDRIARAACHITGGGHRQRVPRHTDDAAQQARPGVSLMGLD